MRSLLLTVLLALLGTGVGATARAQDQAATGTEGASPESGDTAGMDAPMAPPAENTAPPPSAEASGPSKPISAGLLVGYGIGLGLKGGPNPWGLGLGLRGGYNLDKIYLGARFVYYLGKSATFFNGFSSVSATFNIWELGIEGGYDVDAAQGLVVRPLVGLGVANTGISGTGISGASSTDLYLAPGAALLYDVSDSVFLGIDARLQLIFASSLGKGIIFLANGGMHF